eukprot:TRINITY_DN11600_c0_g1_i1.p1 TRINITY_DN11600_c0_g1~~TRINITY_DN11600_c0_g1_i1.p1  ORF type:complete len:339 (-),score=40.58 TRINITY_DN11600_c0_g1_i1:103-1119(-)
MAPKMLGRLNHLSRAELLLSMQAMDTTRLRKRDGIVYVHSENASCVLHNEGSFEERRQRLHNRLRRSREISKADLVQRNIVQSVSVVRRGAHVLEGLLKRRPKPADLIAAGRLPRNYLDILFPDDASASLAPTAKLRPPVSLDQLIGPRTTGSSNAAPLTAPCYSGVPTAAGSTAGLWRAPMPQAMAATLGPIAPQWPGPPVHVAPQWPGQPPFDPAMLAQMMVQAASMMRPPAAAAFTAAPPAQTMAFDPFPTQVIPTAACPKPAEKPGADVWSSLAGASGNVRNSMPLNAEQVRPPKPSLQAARMVTPAPAAYARSQGPPPFVKLLNEFCDMMHQE